jgi:hypothetical protein
MDKFEYIKKINETIHSLQMVTYFDKTINNWEEGMLWQEISIKKNIWEVYFPKTFTRDGYFLAMEIKSGIQQKDYCGYKIK